MGLEIALRASDSPSRGDWQLDETSAVRAPAHICSIGGDRNFPLAKASGVRPSKAACRVVVRLEFLQLAFEIVRMPEQHVVKEFSTDSANQAPHEWMRQRHVGTVLIASISSIRKFACHRCASNRGS